MSYSYVARKPCGCIVAAVVDDPADSRAVAAQEVSRWIRAGLTIERIESLRVRAEFASPCPHEQQITQLNLFGGESHAL